MEEISKLFQKDGADSANDALYRRISGNLDEMLDKFDQVQVTLKDFDQKLVKVLEQHEDDFMFAYKMHMVKIEKELQYLKNKAKEQEKRLT